MNETVRLKIYRIVDQGTDRAPIAVLDFIPREDFLLRDKARGEHIPAFVEQILAANTRDVMFIPNVTVPLAEGSLVVSASYYLGNSGVSVLVKHDEKHVLSIGCLCNTEGTARQNNPYFAVLLQTGDFIEFFVDRE